MVSHNFNSSTTEAEVDLGVRGQPDLWRGFQDRQVYTEKPGLKRKKEREGEKMTPLYCL